MMIDEATGHIKLCDFGIATFFESEIENKQGTKGTARFMAPEAFTPPAKRKGKLHGRALDIWACGVTLYFMLTKKYPFEGSNIVEL